ncbi:Leucine-rich repeat-containing protein 9 [Intoshia linei]|uniref:Leucine-rich repeat-containing protein 9 n=1 Tax=Intoshia linei TaxID=1819745 RepID=A0A177AWP2_9BILA|nr:Leucine-rich repeat-containing protein 9 [Intoshia linei]
MSLTDADFYDEEKTSSENFDKLSKNVYSSIIEIEIFLTKLTAFSVIKKFKNIVKLSIFNQAMYQIPKSFSNFLVLEELWLIDCKLTKIQNVKYMIKLRKLYLYSNKIRSIENCSNLKSLKVFWINKNKIFCLKGLQEMKNLVDLNLADNNIENIEILKELTNLKFLDISCNYIKSLNQFKVLTHLKLIKHLIFYRSYSIMNNPISLLPNYYLLLSTFVPKLSLVDGKRIDFQILFKEAQEIIEKKKIYYNMIIKTRQSENYENTLKLKEIKNGLIKNLIEIIMQIYASISNESESTQDSVCSVKKLIKAIDRMEDEYMNHTNRMKNSLKFYNQLSNIELQNFGSIILENISVLDESYVACSTLVEESFCALKYKKLGITSLKIKKILKIINNNSYNCFNLKRVLLSRPSEKLKFGFNAKSFDIENSFIYAYIIVNNGGNYLNKIKSILVNGAQNNHENVVKVTNSIYICDKSRLKTNNATNNEDESSFNNGFVILAKVYIGNTIEINNKKTNFCQYKSFNTLLYKKNCQLKDTENQDNLIAPHEHNIWYLREKYFIIPEYLIEFDYIYEYRRNYFDSENYNNIPLKEFIQETNNSEDVPINENISLDKVVDTKNNIYHRLNIMLKIFNIEAQFLDRNIKMHFFKNSLIDSKLHNLTNVDLRCSNLNRLKSIQNLTHLEELNLSFNKLSDIDDIHIFPNLRVLNCAFNKIKSITGINKYVNNMKSFDISWNRLENIHEMTCTIHKYMPHLTHLNCLRNNFIINDIRMPIISRVKSLILLNFINIEAEELSSANLLYQKSKISMNTIYKNSSNSTKLDILFIDSTINVPSKTTIKQKYDKKYAKQDKTVKLVKCTSTDMVLNVPLSNNIINVNFKSITWLSVNGELITKISNLDYLTHLTYLSLENNLISSLKGIEHLIRLERLNVSKNYLTYVETLSSLINLKKINLSYNNIIGFGSDSFFGLNKICHISIEANKLETLCFFSHLPSLVELYASHNRICLTQDIIKLRNLAKLRVLDLQYNPVFFIQDYRFFVLFHITHIQYLDGKFVKIHETIKAKKIFGGRLSIDMVTDTVEHTNFDLITVISFKNCGIDTIDEKAFVKLNNLKVLNFDENNLTSLDGLFLMKKLLVLSLNNNCISTISYERADNVKKTSRVLESLEVLHLA